MTLHRQLEGPGMSNAGNLWAVGFDETERAAQVRDEITKRA
jgi:hypothetical protein